MDVDKFYNTLRTLPIDKEKNQKPLSNNSIVKIHSILHSALEYAKVNKKLMSNPIDYVKPPKKDKFIPNILDEKNFNKLYSAVHGTFDEIPIVLAACTGLRRSEIFGLTWKNIDMENCLIRIEKITTRYSKYITKKPKSNSSQRTFAVPKFVIDILKNYRSSLKVVPEYVCDKFKAQSYSGHFKLILEKNKLPEFRFHDLRHFNAIIMMKYNIPDKVASERLGHAHVSTTRQIYQHVISDMDREAANIIDNVFNKAK
jgi:integrase